MDLGLLVLYFLSLIQNDHEPFYRLKNCEVLSQLIVRSNDYSIDFDNRVYNLSLVATLGGRGINFNIFSKLKGTLSPMLNLLNPLINNSSWADYKTRSKLKLIILLTCVL